MTDWIEINLPWQSYYLDDRQTIIDHDAIQARAKIELGKSLRESNATISEKLQQEYFDFRTAYEESHPDEDSDNSKDAARALDKFALIREHQDFVSIFNEWYAQQPEVIEQRKLDETARQESRQKSFTGRGLNNPGTLIEYVDHEGVVRQALIGDINQLGGVCDDCRDIESSDIVKRYRVVYDPSKPI